MESKEKESIIKKIKKTLALSKSSNEHEAMAAMKKAQELMMKYLIDEKELEQLMPWSKELPAECYSKRRK